MDDTNALSADEAKYFETGGETAPPEVIETEAPPAEKVETEKVTEAKAPEKVPTEIEVVEDDDGTGEPDARKFVKVGVLRREREKAKQFRSELDQTRQQFAALKQQFEAQRNPPRQLAPEEVPHVALQRVQNLESQLAQQAAKSDFVNSYARSASEYTKEQADFPSAYQHLLSARQAQYEIAGYGPEQVAQLLESEEAAIVEKAMIDGENPAKRIYQIASKVYGYKPAAKIPGVTEAGAKAITESTDKAVKSAQKLADIAAGMEKNKSISGAGSGDGPPTLAELAEMDDAAFDKATAGKKWKELMGG